MQVSINYAIKMLIDSVFFGITFYLLTSIIYHCGGIIYVTASEEYSLEGRLVGRQGEPPQRVRGSGLSSLS